MFENTLIDCCGIALGLSRAANLNLLNLGSQSDIEGFVEEWEVRNNKKVLKRIDIPFSERETAMKDLKIMGFLRRPCFPV